MEHMMCCIWIDQSKDSYDRARRESFAEKLCYWQDEALIVGILDESGKYLEEIIIISFRFFLILLSSLDLSLGLFIRLFLFFALFTHCLWGGGTSFTRFYRGCDIEIFHS
jgi:hypothetical protein